MIITEKDMKYLQRTVSKKYRKRMIIFLIIMTLFCIGVGLFSIYHSNRWANIEGLNVWQVCKMLENISPEKNYSGVILLSAERLYIGFIWVLLGILVGSLSLFSFFTINKTNERILKYIEEKK